MQNLEAAQFLGWSIFICGGLSLFTQWLSGRLANPGIGIFSRWSRCLFFSTGLSFIALQMEWNWTYRPLWNLVAIFFLFWLFFETIYLWIFIRRFSMANLPVHPQYFTLPNKGEWPMQPHFIRIREWLRENGYEQIEALKANLAEDLHLRAFVFEDDKGLVRIQVAFTVVGQAANQVLFALSSITESGKRMVTDNAFLPRAGFLPDKWELRRFPLIRSLAALEKRHKKTMKKSNHVLVAWTENVLDEMQEQHGAIEKTNVEKGILFPRTHREENGTYTQEGRYKIWKQIIFLNYLGFCR